MCQGSSLGASEGLQGASGSRELAVGSVAGEVEERRPPGPHVFQVSGKWFITAFVENKGLTGDRVLPITFSVLSDTHVWASMTHR